MGKPVTEAPPTEEHATETAFITFIRKRAQARGLQVRMMGRRKALLYSSRSGYQVFAVLQEANGFWRVVTVTLAGTEEPITFLGSERVTVSEMRVALRFAAELIDSLI